MRILLVSANFRPHVGGVERFTEVLASELSARGHEVGVICCAVDGSRAQFFEDGYTVERLRATYVLDRRFNVPYPLPEPVGLRAALARWVAWADVVHVQDVLYATSLPSLLMARRRKTASVLTQHIGFVPQRSAVLNAVERGAYSLLGPCVRLASIVATYNETVAAWIENRWRPPDVRVLPIGVPGPGSEILDRRRTRRSFDLPEDAFIALFVGRDVRVKGLDLFLDAADPAYTLAAVTDRQYSGSDAVVLPFMASERLHALMGCVDAFVLPSESEGFPLSLQEALATGLPTVTTRLPGYERFLTSDDVLFIERDAQSIRNALHRLVTDAALRSKLSLRARAAAERHFGVSNFVSAYEDVYADAIARSAN